MKIVNTRLTEVFMVFFALAEMLPTSGTCIHLKRYCFKWIVEFFGVLKGARHLGFSEEVPRGGGLPQFQVF